MSKKNKRATCRETCTGDRRRLLSLSQPTRTPRAPQTSFRLEVGLLRVGGHADGRVGSPKLNQRVNARARAQLTPPTRAMSRRYMMPECPHPSDAVSATVRAREGV